LTGSTSNLNFCPQSQCTFSSIISGGVFEIVRGSVLKTSRFGNYFPLVAGGTGLRYPADGGKKFLVKCIFSILLLASVALCGQCAEAEYKQVLITTGTNVVRVRLPLTDVTGKVRVKEKSADGFGLPLAPSKTVLGKKHYLEWQIGYDTPDVNDVTVVKKIKFMRKGETKYGHELSKIIFESVRLGLLTTNEILADIQSLEKIRATEFEENQPVSVDTETNDSAGGFQRAVQRVPQFTKNSAHGSVQIQLKPKQRAVGYQAMVYVCLPLTEVLTLDGEPRKAGRAKSKETVYYDFTNENGALLRDVIHAFGLASAQHNEDMRTILKLVLKQAAD
jgi:hypothetical protein